MVGNDTYASLYRNPTLFLRCQGNEFDAFVAWGGRFIAAGSDDQIPTVYRVDEANPKSTYSGESTSNESSFFFDPGEFTRALLDAEEVLIRVTNYDYETMTARFSVEELRDVVSELPCENIQ